MTSKLKVWIGMTFAHRSILQVKKAFGIADHVHFGVIEWNNMDLESVNRRKRVVLANAKMHNKIAEKLIITKTKCFLATPHSYELALLAYWRIDMMTL